MAKTDRAVTRRRRGYWIQRARVRRKLTLDTLAELVGYAKGSGSVISRWESGERAVPSDRFPRIAEELGLPPDFLVNPPETDEERLDEAMRLASGLESADWEAGEDRSPSADGGPAVSPRRRSA